MTTKVKVKCTYKKETEYYDKKTSPIQWEIGLSVPYDPKSIYYQMSGGTSPVLYTVNKEAADMFEIGKDYMIEISPAIEE